MNTCSAQYFSPEDCSHLNRIGKRNIYCEPEHKNIPATYNVNEKEKKNLKDLMNRIIKQKFDTIKYNLYKEIKYKLDKGKKSIMLELYLIDQY